MHDVGSFWPTPPDLTTTRIEGRGFAVVTEAPRQTLISGAVDAGIAALAPGVVPQGPYRPVAEETYAIRLGIDRALLVETRSAAPHDESRWHAAGFAASDVGDAYVVMTITGPAAFDILARGTGVDLRGAAPVSGGGATMRFAETALIAYRYRDGLRLHVERSRVPYLCELLSAFAQIL